MGVPGEEKGVQSVARAMDVVEAVAAAGEVGVTELARTLELHVPLVDWPLILAEP